MQLENETCCQFGKTVIEIEMQAIQQLLQRIDETFTKACEYLFNCSGRIIVTGMGKSGHIGRKIASTLASTGSPAFFIHAAEASHGDLGMITPQDVILAISNSGTTQEILTILPIIKRLNIPLITMTGNPASTLAQVANVNLDVSVATEACPLNLAPSASTTATLVMGDALAITLLRLRGFTEEDFAFSHPGGRLGRRLLLRIDEVMHQGDAVPKVKHTALLRRALIEMSQKSLGMTAIVDDQEKLVGVFTDGDLRRALDKGYDVHTTLISDVMTKNCMTVSPETLAVEALNIMESRKITALLVIDEKGKLVGAFNIHDLLRTGVV